MLQRVQEDTDGQEAWLCLYGRVTNEQLYMCLREGGGGLTARDADTCVRVYQLQNGCRFT